RDGVHRRRRHLKPGTACRHASYWTAAMATNCNARRQLNRVTALAVLVLAIGFIAFLTRQPEQPPPGTEQNPAPSGTDAGEFTFTVEFRRAETVPGMGLTSVLWPQTEQTIYLHPEAEVTDADIAEAAAGLNRDRDRSRHEVLIRFTKAGGEKMARLYE